MADAINRRGLFGGLAAGAAAASLPASTLAAGQARDQLAPFGQEWSGQNWSRGLEGQRRADLDDGRFLNPIMAGDRPDPTILKDGDVYYMTFSSFESVPGLVIWRSTDLVNWTPVTVALKRYIGSVWAPELCRHEGRYYLYVPARTEEYRSNYVLWADDIAGPWSEPIDLHLPDHIHPGHRRRGWRALSVPEQPRHGPPGPRRPVDSGTGQTRL